MTDPNEDPGTVGANPVPINESPVCDEPRVPFENWLEREIAKRFPDGETLPSGQLRVRVCQLCFELLDLVAARQKEKHDKLRADVFSLSSSIVELAEELRRCDECDPSFGCFDGSAPCSKKSVPPGMVKRAAMLLVMHPVKEHLFLVVKDGDDVLLPGGHVEAGESIWKAAQRELKEETDLHVYYEDLVLIGHGKGIAEPDCEVIVLLARTVFGEEKPMEPGTTLHWADWKMLLEKSSFRSFYEKHFPKAFSHLKPTVWKA